MDFVNKAKDAIKSGSGSSGTTNTNTAAGGAQKEDYGDKGLSPFSNNEPSTTRP